MRLVKQQSQLAANDATPPATLARLDEIQQNMRTLCDPHYDEFHKTRVEHGFVTITIPRKTRR